MGRVRALAGQLSNRRDRVASEAAKPRRLAINELRDWNAVIPVSAYLNGPDNRIQLDVLLTELVSLLPVGPALYADDAITDETLDQFVIVARWDDVADRMIERYRGIASRLVIYLASHWHEVDPKVLERWGEVARAVRKAG